MKLSIITINLNNSQGLLRTIESVLVQSYADYEYIIIDGGSVDDSVEIINKYSQKLFYWISESDSGIYEAMNKGIKVARGEYCLFLNSGDWLVDNCLKIIMADNSPHDIIYGNAIYYNIEKSVVNKNQKNIQKTLSFYDFFNGESISHQTAFIRRKLFESYGLYDESLKIVSDWAFFIRTIIFGNVTFIHKDIDIAYIEIGGISSAFDPLHLLERKIVLEKFLPLRIIDDYEELKTLKETLRITNENLRRFQHRFGILDKVISFLKTKLLVLRIDK